MAREGLESGRLLIVASFAPSDEQGGHRSTFQSAGALFYTVTNEKRADAAPQADLKYITPPTASNESPCCLASMSLFLLYLSSVVEMSDLGGRH